MYITVIVLVLLLLFFRKEDFTMYFRKVEGGVPRGSYSHQHGSPHRYGPGESPSRESSGSVDSAGSSLSGETPPGRVGDLGKGSGGRQLIGTGLLGPAGNPILV
tara:strand:- start:531 stop:842 length:312 start_codon:yes stop_codon:yes gene_type:complete